MTRILCGGLFFILVLTGAAPGQTNAPTVGSPTLVVNDEPDHGIAAANHIKELMREHKLDEALAAAQVETQNHPDQVAAWYSLGDVLMFMHRYQEALPPLQKAVAIAPKGAAVQYDLGVCLLATKQVDPAIDALTLAVKGMPDWLPAWGYLYEACVAKGDIVGMEKKFEDYTVTFPQNPNAWYMLGEVQIYEQLPDSAIASWQKAIDLKPDHYETLKKLGLIYGRGGQPEKAIQYFARAAAIKPDAELVNNLGYSYLSLGQTDKAIEAFKHSLELDPKYEKALYNLADAYSRQKQWALAWREAHALAQVNPQSADRLTKTFPPEGGVALLPDSDAAPTNAVAAIPPSPATDAPPAPSTTATPPPPTPSSPASSGVLVVSPISAQSSLLLPPATANSATVATPPATPDPPSTPATNTTPAAASQPTAATTSPGPTPAPAAPAPTSSTPTYSIAPPPAWVKSLDPDTVNAPAVAGSNGGLDYILIDNQQQVQPQGIFKHCAVRLVNEQGLQVGSDLRAGFDPNYQTLIINWLRVKRDGTWSDRLRNDSFQLIRREENLDSQMLDGRYSAICHLQDVRVGDIVDFAYTVTGANPVFGGKFVDSFATGYPQPVGLFSMQVAVPQGRNIAVKGFGGAHDPVRTVQPDGSQLLTWRQENIPASIIEPGIPPYYDALPWVELSEFDTWNDVAKWGLDTFSLDEPLSPDLQEEVDSIKAAHTTPSTRAMAAINFVQDQVRYLGIEMGANSYKPTPASQVFARRFGDCEDKTQLCVVMLHALQITASPMLVNTTRGEATGDFLPSPLDFDHAIVSLFVDGHLYCADPTRTGQRGELRDLAVDDFKRGLLVTEDATHLSRIALSPASLPRITIDQAYKVTSATDPAQLLIHAVYRGSAAEGVRDSFSALSHEELQKDYLDYYGRVYPQIKEDGEMRSQDFPGDNRFEVWHSYTVPGLWTRDSASVPYQASFIPFSIVPTVGHTTPVPRAAPYRIDYPADVTVNMEIDLFDNWPLQVLPAHVETPNFTFVLSPWVQENVIHLQYHYQALAPDVPPAGIAEYNDAVERIRNQLEYRLAYTPGVSPNGVGALQPDWEAVCILGLAFSVSVAVCTGIYFIRRSRDDDYDDYHSHSPYEGIGGWLVCICIGMALRAFFSAKSLFAVLAIFLNKPKFDLLTQPGSAQYNPYWAPVLYYEGCACLAMLVFLLLAAVLLIQKRFTFPAVMIGTIAANILLTGIDHAMVLQIYASRPNETPLPPNFASMVFSAAIWIPYLLVSKRVKATFRY
ncbi:MAG TPA: DUF3857 domain-containing protein [Candidatus Methylacidiphilales bacterium]|nr:DUF3857 domain-containing protein [Candidatus Methylacidiphilales bacterium]